MSEKFGMVIIGHKEEFVFLGCDFGEQWNYSEEVVVLLDEEIRAIVSDAYEEAKRILTRQRGKMDVVVERLKMVETIDVRELDEIFASPVGASAQEVG